MTAATLGIGTKLQFETTPGASPITWTTVSEMGDLPPLPHTREFVEATNQDSLGFTREYIAGLIDAEEFTVTGNYLPQDASQIAVWTMSQTKDAGKRQWRVLEETASPAVSWQFEAAVSNFAPGFPVADKKTLAITLRRSGPTTRA